MFSDTKKISSYTFHLGLLYLLVEPRADHRRKGMELELPCGVVIAGRRCCIAPVVAAVGP
jgi:hypothetical protein